MSLIPQLPRSSPGAVLPVAFILGKQGPSRCLPKEQDKRQRRCHSDHGGFLPICCVPISSTQQSFRQDSESNSHGPATMETFFTALFQTQAPSLMFCHHHAHSKSWSREGITSGRTRIPMLEGAGDQEHGRCLYRKRHDGLAPRNQQLSEHLHVLWNRNV